MSRIRTLGASLIAIAAAGGSAAAADLSTYSPPPPAAVYNPAPAATWNGAYIGGLIGYGWGDAKFDPPTVDVDGITGGIYTGMNFQPAPNWVVGVEGDIMATNMKGSVPGGTVKNPWNGTLRGRAGFVFGHAMIYGAAGLAVGRVKVEDAVGATEAHNRVGFTLAGGAEALLGGNVIGRAEYRYTDLGSDTYLGDTMSYTSSQALVGLGLKF